MSLCPVSVNVIDKVHSYGGSLRLETMGSPALGQGSNCKLFTVSFSLVSAGKGNLQGVFEMLVDFHDRGLVAASVAVVGGCERRQ